MSEEMAAGERIGEIIETGTVAFVAESFALHRPPALGQMVYVTTADRTHVYGVVCHGTTASPDPGRRAVRRSTDGVYDEEVYREHPQLRHTLHTVFTARLVGYSDQERIHRHLPPQPPPLHYSVHLCPPSEVKAFTERLIYLRLLWEATEVPPEQLLAAHIREAYRARDADRAWLTRAAREVAGMLKNDYERLLVVLYNIDPDA